MVPKNAPRCRTKAIAAWPDRGHWHGSPPVKSAAPLEASILGDTQTGAAVRAADRTSKAEPHAGLPVFRLGVMAGPARRRGAAPFAPRCRIRPFFTNAVAYAIGVGARAPCVARRGVGGDLCRAAVLATGVHR